MRRRHRHTGVNGGLGARPDGVDVTAEPRLIQHQAGKKSQRQPDIDCKGNAKELFTRQRPNAVRHVTRRRSACVDQHRAGEHEPRPEGGHQRRDFAEGHDRAVEDAHGNAEDQAREDHRPDALTLGERAGR